MRNLVTYRPYRPALANFDRWFDSVFQNWGLPHSPGIAGSAPTAPRVNVREQADAYHLEAELPGLTEKDFTVNVEHNLLTIASEQERNEEREENGYVIRERRSGAFRRSFSPAGGCRRRPGQRHLQGRSADPDGAQERQGAGAADRREQRRLGDWPRNPYPIPRAPALPPGLVLSTPSIHLPRGARNGAAWGARPWPRRRSGFIFVAAL